MIGVIDSGVGGLSVLREIHRLLPDRDLSYIADTAYCPYGPRPADEIRERVALLTDQLIARGAEAIVLACNSATIHAIESLRSVYPLPFIGMEPAIKPAAALTRSGVVGLLATEASLAGEKLHRLIDQHAATLRVITRPCPAFVTLVEKGQLEGTEVDQAIDAIISPLLAEGVDTLILGCSHYPFLRPAIERRVPRGVEILDTGEPVARRVADLCPSIVSSSDRGQIQIATTGDLLTIKKLSALLVPGINPTFTALTPSDLEARHDGSDFLIR